MNRQAPNTNAPRSSMPDIRPGRPGAGPNARMNVEKPKNMWRTIGRLLRYIGRNGVLLAALLVFMALTTLVDLLGPMFQQLAIDTIKVADEGLSVDLEALFTYLAIMGIAVCLFFPHNPHLWAWERKNVKVSVQKEVTIDG